MYSCANCDTQYLKWQGRCNECGHWGSLKLSAEAESFSGGATGGASGRAKATGPVGKVEVTTLADLPTSDQKRLTSHLPDFNAVLGGGIASGSLVLLAGEPGIGKSTFVLQLIDSFTPKPETLYLAGEESPEQIKSRLDRLKIQPQIKLLRQPSLEQAVVAIEQNKPGLVIVDSIQTLSSNQIDSPAGSLNQIRACAAQLLEICKKLDITCLIIGQVTKDGVLAGPKALEHLVDTVLYLDGDQVQDYRILRVTKNRFGPTDEIMVLSMTPAGLKVIDNPSMIFLEDGHKHGEGSVVVPIVDGSKIFLVEVQALVTSTNFGYPQRRSAGFDNNRLQLLLAVLTKRARLTQLNSHDVHINVVGGYKITEPAADLAVCLAVASSLLGREGKICAFGEVGLNGEIRKVKKIEARLKEAQKLGVSKIISPGQVKNIQEAISLL